MLGTIRHLRLKISIFLVFFAAVLYQFSFVNCTDRIENARLEKDTERYQVARFNFEEVSEVYTITLWILVGSLAKIGKFYALTLIV